MNVIAMVEIINYDDDARAVPPIEFATLFDVWNDFIFTPDSIPTMLAHYLFRKGFKRYRI